MCSIKQKDSSTEHLIDITRFETSQRNSKKLSTQCKICGAPALYSYFGTIACSSCKVFFRRNALINHKKCQCIYNGHCEINVLNRHICSSCRLAKCFASGMQVQMIRASTGIRSREKFQSSNLLETNQSTLTIEQWNLISNLTHCYDEYNGITYTQQFLSEQNQLSSNISFKISSISEYFRILTSEAQLLYKQNSDFISLCPHDRSILLGKTMKYVAGFSTCFILRETRALGNQSFYQSSEILYGSIAMSAIYRAVEHIDCDSIFIKLILVLFTFSTFDYIYYKPISSNNLKDIKTILSIQDKYSQLIWEYLLHKYDHRRAVLSFSNLIQCLFPLNSAIIEVAQHKQYTDMIDSHIKQIEETITCTL